MKKRSRRFCLNCKADTIFRLNLEKGHSYCETCGGYAAMRKDYYFELRVSVLNQFKEKFIERLKPWQEQVTISEVTKLISEMTQDKRDTEDF